MLHQCDSFSQLTAFRKRFEGLQPEVVDLSHLPCWEAGGQIEGSAFHGTLNTTCGVGLMAVCLEGSTITRAAGGGNDHRGFSSSESSCSPREASWASPGAQLWYHGVQLHTVFLPFNSAAVFLSDFLNGFELSGNQKWSLEDLKKINKFFEA